MNFYAAWVKIDGFSMVALTKPARKKENVVLHLIDAIPSCQSLYFLPLIIFVVPFRLFHGITDPNQHFMYSTDTPFQCDYLTSSGGDK